MIKKIFLLSLFFYTIFITAQLSPIAADYCSPGCCSGSWATDSKTYVTGCKFYTSEPEMGFNYCGNTGTTGDDCLCTDPNTCTCTTHSSDRGENGIRCDLTEEEVEVCRCQENKNHPVCKTNVECRGYEDGAYPNDVCGCNASEQGCVLVPGSYQRWCCVFDETCGPGSPGPATNTPQPPPPGSSSTPTTSVPPTGPVPDRILTVNINVFRAASATLNPDQSCSATSSSTYSEGAFVSLSYPGRESITQPLDANSSAKFTIIGVTANEEFNIKIYPQDSSYSCTCPNGCLYALTVPAVGTDVINRNIYLSNFAGSWWQVVGGNTFANGMLKSIVPDHLCTAPTCLAGVFLPLPSQSVLTSGFPFLHGTTLNSIVTHQNASENLANIHLAGQRTTAQSADGVVLGFAPALPDYDYFYQLAQNTGTINNVTSLDLAAWRSIHDTQGLTIFKLSGNQTISQSNRLFVQNGEKVVIFVDGNLTIEDSQSGGGHKITAVTQKTLAQAGGFLGIFVKGDIVNGGITIKPSVGTALDTNNPENITPVNITNAHLEGVFFSNGDLTIEGNNTYPHYKFIGAGTFIGKNRVTLGRKTDNGTAATEQYKIHNNYQALENFIYRPDLLVNWPNELKSSIINWREVAPKSFNF